MVSPGQSARAVVPRGTTCVIMDPHETANVCGLEDIRYMLDSGTVARETSIVDKLKLADKWNKVVDGHSPGIKDEDLNAHVIGGLVIVSKGKVLGSLPLPIAGLISDKSTEEVKAALKKMLDTAYNSLNVNRKYDPFMTLAFLALSVIPEVKVTDRGLFNVNKFEFIDISITP